MKGNLRPRVLTVILSTLACAALDASALEALPKTVPGFENNPDKISLGRMLYFDKRVSGDGTLSCNSCHDVATSGTDNLPFSKGIHGQLGGRNAPTVFNAAYMSVQFWDGRAPSLEEQAKGPITNPVEMGMESHAACVATIAKIPGYAPLFKKVYGDKGDPFTIENIVGAIAAYERTLVTPNSPVDRFIAGDQKALNAAQKKGMDLVQKVGCTTCHFGLNYAGPAMPAGAGFYQKFPLIAGSKYDKQYGFLKDNGRYDVTKTEGDRHFYRVPTWRNIALTAPYFHNGSVKTLDEAVRVMAKTQLNKSLKADEVVAIVEFLKALTGELPKEKEPVLPQ